MRAGKRTEGARSRLDRARRAAGRSTHSGFLRRNGAMMSALLATGQRIVPSSLPLIEEALFYATTGGLSSVARPRTRDRLAPLLREAVREWPHHRSAALKGSIGPRAERRICAMLGALSRGEVLRDVATLKFWPLERWERAFRKAGLSRSDAATFMALVLGREEVFPFGSTLQPMYRRIGLSVDDRGRPRAPPFDPRHSQPLRWRLVDLALNRCTAALTPNIGSCGGCPIRLFCQAGRAVVSTNTRKERGSGGLEFADVFAGGGGLSLGFRQAGLRQRVAVEFEEHAADTLYLNHPEAEMSGVLRRDVRRLFADEKFLQKYRGIPILVGGPPCQPYSMARRHMRPDRIDHRRLLFRSFVHLGRALEVRMIVMENVPGLQTAGDGAMLRRVLRVFDKEGFDVQYRVCDASKFGVPQFRHRMFFIALNRSLWGDTRTAFEKFWSSLEDQERPRRVSVRQALSGIPRVGPGEGGPVVGKERKRGTSTYGRLMANGSSLTFNHEARAHNPRDLEIFTKLRQGEIARRLDEREPGLVPYQVDSFPDKFRKLRADRPAPTIPAHLSRDSNSFVHPEVPRGITCREAARLQSFPDDYLFLGGFGPALIQTGNAVPPLLGRAVARAAISAFAVSMPAGSDQQRELHPLPPRTPRPLEDAIPAA